MKRRINLFSLMAGAFSALAAIPSKVVRNLTPDEAPAPAVPRLRTVASGIPTPPPRNQRQRRKDFRQLMANGLA